MWHINSKCFNCSKVLPALPRPRRWWLTKFWWAGTMSAFLPIRASSEACWNVRYVVNIWREELGYVWWAIQSAIHASPTSSTPNDHAPYVENLLIAQVPEISFLKIWPHCVDLNVNLLSGDVNKTWKALCWIFTWNNVNSGTNYLYRVIKDIA